MSDDIGNLIAAIDIGKDMAAGNLNISVSAHAACRTAPLAGSIRIISAAAAEDVAEETVAAAGFVGTAMR